MRIGTMKKMSHYMTVTPNCNKIEKRYFSFLTNRDLFDVCNVVLKKMEIQNQL